MRKIITLVLFINLIGCGGKGSPSELYEEYNSKVINGVPFDEEKKYYSKSKLKRLEETFPKYMEQMNKSKEEVIEFYQEFSQSVAKCKSIKLIEEERSGNNVTLVYLQKDICNNESRHDEKQTVTMINENGWKIMTVEISI